MLNRGYILLVVIVLLLTGCTEKQNEENRYDIMQTRGKYVSNLEGEITGLVRKYELGSTYKYPAFVLTNKYIFGGTDNEFTKIDLQSGDREWSYATNSIYSPSVILDSSVCFSDEVAMQCLDITNGQTLWKREYTSRAEYLSPVVASSNLVLFSDKGYIAALEAKTGEEKWRREYDSINAGFGPYNYDNKIYLQGNNGIEMINIKNGELVKTLPFTDPFYTLDVSGELLAFNTYNVVDYSEEIVLYNEKENKVVWTYRPDNQNSYGYLSLVRIVEDIILVENPEMGTIEALDKITGKRNWIVNLHNLIGKGFTTIGSVSGDRLYISNGPYIVCLSLASGELLWSFKNDESIISPPIILDEKIYGLSENNEVILFNTDDE